MDEFEFQRILDLFPIVRSRDYHADEESSRRSTAPPTQNEDARDRVDEREVPIQGIEQHDAFWAKLKMAAEKKVGAAEAERFCEAFKKVHKKLVYEELSLDAARRFLSLSKSSED